MRFTTIAVVAVAVPVCAAVAQQATTAKRAFASGDWYKVTTVAAPALSPDGGKVAFTVTTVREAENRRHSEVWVVPAQGRCARALHVARVRELGASLFRRWQDPLLHVAATRRPRHEWALRMDEPSGEAYQPTERAASDRIVAHGQEFRCVLGCWWWRARRRWTRRSRRGPWRRAGFDGERLRVDERSVRPRCSRSRGRRTTRSRSPRIRRGSTAVRSST